jgi:F-type H+-transporting ATPase subunit b
MEALGISLGYFIFQVLNFLIVVILLYAWAYRPIVNALENRKQRIAQGLEDARIASEARANAEREADRIVSEAQTRAGQVVREATERAEAAAREVRDTAQAEAAKERDIALAEVEQERERILSEVRGQVAILAMAAAQKLVGAALDEQRQHALIDEFFSGIKSGRVTVLDEAQVDGGGSAEVTSALPLTNEEKDTIRRDILSKAGSQSTVTFRVDPSILGGLVVRVGDRVWDASVSGQLENLRQNMV